MKCVFEQFPEVYGWAHCTFACTPLLPPRLPHPPFPPTSVTSVRNNMIYHTNISFSATVIALISLLTFPTIPPACIFHAYPEMASLHPHSPMIVLKIRCLIFHSRPGASCATIMFTSVSTCLEAGEFSLCLSLLVPVKISPSERPRWEASCCFFEVTGKKGADMRKVCKKNERQGRCS